MHIEEGEPVFINNQSVRKSLVNHTWAFTLFTDGTASCGKKEFSGKMEIAGKEYEYFSVNDTIVRNGSKTYYANLYTSRYKEVPHASHPELVNPLSKTAYYVVAKYSNGVMTAILIATEQIAPCTNLISFRVTLIYTFRTGTTKAAVE